MSERNELREQWIVTVPDGRRVDVLALVAELRHIVESVDRGIYDASAFAASARRLLQDQGLLP